MRICYILLLSLLLASCDTSRVYDENYDLGKDGWKESQVLIFNFEIKDTISTYDVFYNIRYTNDYPNYNLYLKHFIFDPKGKMITSKLNGMDLFRPTSGEPYGSGFGGTFDYKIWGVKSFKFPHVGKYSMKLQQYMRQSTIPGILSFGLRIEKNIPGSKD